MTSSVAENEIDSMMLNDPETFFRLLRGYMMMIGRARQWWKATEHGDDPEWASAVRHAIAEMARASRTTANQLAQFLDAHDGSARARCLAIASARYAHGLR